MPPTCAGVSSGNQHKKTTEASFRFLWNEPQGPSRPLNLVLTPISKCPCLSWSDLHNLHLLSAPLGHPHVSCRRRGYGLRLQKTTATQVSVGPIEPLDVSWQLDSISPPPCCGNPETERKESTAFWFPRRAGVEGLLGGMSFPFSKLRDLAGLQVICSTA